ncbi:MAG: ChrR family anti-sigma-E factor [Pseudomonadota bacterium]
MGFYNEHDEIVMAHAAGLLPPAQALVIETQAALREDVRRELKDCEAIAAALMEDCAPADLSADLRARVMDQLDLPAEEPVAPPSGCDHRLPEPLRGVVGKDLDSLPWRWVMPGLRDCVLPLGAAKSPPGNGGTMRLMWVRAGTRVPAHSHRGLEMTLVLQGAYRDATGIYGAGDLQLADERVDHGPEARAGADCLCLVVTEGPVRLTGRFGRLFDRIVRY